MRPIIKFLTYVIAALSVSGTLSSADKQPFTLTITPSTESVKSGAKLSLSVRVTNTPGQAIGFVRSPAPTPEEGFRYEVVVRGPQGEEPPPSAYARELAKKTTMVSGSNVAKWLKPGESFVDEVDISKLYDLSRPGKYSIWVAREMPAAQNLGKGKVKSNSIIVTVLE